jgi:pilus assembly protein CpaB
MNIARIVVLTITLSAGGATYPASGSDSKPPSAERSVQLQTFDVLVAKSDLGLNHTVTPSHVQWQTWPASTTVNTFIRRNERPDAILHIASTLSPALRRIADVSQVEIGADDRARQRGNTTVVRYGVTNPTIILK